MMLGGDTARAAASVTSDNNWNTGIADPISLESLSSPKYRVQEKSSKINTYVFPCLPLKTGTTGRK